MLRDGVLGHGGVACNSKDGEKADRGRKDGERKNGGRIALRELSQREDCPGKETQHQESITFG